MPENCHEASGWKKFRYVGRMWFCDVAHDPPRSTNWFTMNLPLYSPDGARRGAVSGVGAVRARRPLPDVAVELEEPGPGGVGLARRLGVEPPRIDEVALDRGPACADLPLLLERKARARPARVGVGLVPVHVADRLVGIHGCHPAQGERPPAAVFPLPVERLGPPVLVAEGPPLGHPQLGAPVAAVLHEGEVLAVRDRSMAQRERLEEASVPGRLVVEAEALSVPPDLAHAFLELDPAERRPLSPNPVPATRVPILAIRARVPVRRRLRSRGVHLEVRGPERVHAEHVLDVREQQLLVLLLVVEPQLDQCPHVVGQIAVQEPFHGLVHRFPVAPDLRHGRARQVASPCPAVALSGLHVVRVEEERVGRVVELVPRQVGHEEKRLEEPRRVREMPLGGTHVGHRLHDLIFRRESSGQIAAALTDVPVPVQERARRSGGTNGGGGRGRCVGSIRTGVHGFGS